MTEIKKAFFTFIIGAAYLSTLAILSTLIAKPVWVACKWLWNLY